MGGPYIPKTVRRASTNADVAAVPVLHLTVPPSVFAVDRNTTVLFIRKSPLVATISVDAML